MTPFDLYNLLYLPLNKWRFETKSHEKDVLHIFLALIVKNKIFAYLTMKLTF